MLLFCKFLPGSPIHQLISDTQHRHQMSESSSSLQQMYATGMPETGRDHNFKTDTNLGGNISPYNTTSNSTMGSPIHQSMFGQMPNLGMFSGNTSPTINPLLSPNGSPIYGTYGTSGNLPQPSSVSSITQGNNCYILHGAWL